MTEVSEPRDRGRNRCRRRDEITIAESRLGAMTTGPIPVSSARTLIPFTDFMRWLGAPVDRWFERCRLPSRLHEMPDADISTLKHWEFVAIAAETEGIEDLGVRVAKHRIWDAIGPRILQGVASAPTLLRGIEEFTRRVQGEASASRVWMSRRGASVEIHLKRPFTTETAGYDHTEWLAMIAQIRIIQLFAGKQWQPTAVSVRSPRPAPVLANELFPAVRFLTGQENAFLRFHEEVLSLGPIDASSEVMTRFGPGSRRVARGRPPSSFVESLEWVLVPYLREGYPSLDAAAEIVGTSPRTLQRRLAEAGLSYSEVIDRTRFGVATTMLTKTESTSIDIARATGYGDASHFARAFKRLAGCSPSAYRRRHLDQ